MTTIVDPDFVDTPELRARGFKLSGVVGSNRIAIKGAGRVTSAVVPVTTAAFTSTSGDLLLSLAYTPKVVGSRLKWRGRITAGVNNTNWLSVAAFIGSTLMDVPLQANYTSTVTNTLYPEFQTVASDLSPVTVNLRWGINASGTATLNSATGGSPGTFNNAIESWFEVEEWV